MNRPEMLQRLRDRKSPWDLLVIGGGATGVGVALDGAARGYDVLLLERGDFGQGTSSRSTKLIHGGVRYLEQGNLALVMEALRERGLLSRNAPGLVHNLAFVVPSYDWWEAPFYGAGLKLYNLLAGKYAFGAPRILTRDETLARLPNIRTEGLRGGVVYFDGQFDDSRLLIQLAATAVGRGATLLNYLPVTALTKDARGCVNGLRARDAETGEEFEPQAKVVVNAAGPFSDEVRRMGDPFVQPLIAPSQGVHLVFDNSFLSGDAAIMVPHTADGRVMFAIPWLGHTLVGTTDTPIPAAVSEPAPQEQEIEFILRTASLYLEKKPSRSDVLSVFAGIRPLVAAGAAGNTASLARSHMVRIEETGMVTICGGKWTTYRHMAEDAVNQAAALAGLPERPCVTRTLAIVGPLRPPEPDAPLDSALPYTGEEVVWAARHEMARTVDDALARRTRALFLNARAALRMAPRAAELMARELGRNDRWAASQVQSFQRMATKYLAD